VAVTFYGRATVNNCIVYYNRPGNYFDGWRANLNWSFNYCCTTPLPTGGTGNISLDPQLATATYLSATSPCRGAGSAAYASGTDIDGEPWATPPSIGCDEYYAGALTGPLAVGIVAAFTNVAVGFPVELTALIQGRTTASVWDFADGFIVTNQPCATHVWTAPGDYAVVLRAYNETHPDGMSATAAVHVVMDPVHYVAAGSANPVPPYTAWATAATNIQDAVDAATVTGALVLVSNGVYVTGGRAVSGTMTNRVAVAKPLTLRSVNGPEVTVIQGYQVPGTTNGDGAIRCVYLTNAASLSGFTLTNGATRTNGHPEHEQCGGGVWCASANAILTNCLMVGNSAQWGGGSYSGTFYRCRLAANLAEVAGGGASEGMLHYCELTGNSTESGSGGACCGSTLYNCTLNNNSAHSGGGASTATLFNCVLNGNSADSGGGADGGTLNGCTLSGNSAKGGGGAFMSTLENCVLTGNSAESEGGGALGSVLYHCTLTGNSAQSGGGVSQAFLSTLYNCIVYSNRATIGPNYFGEWIQFNYSCTTPMPTNGFGNITNAPLFVDYPNGNLRLQSNSPCIDAGFNAYAPGPTDLDGNPRIVRGTVDIGAYEFQGPGSVISYVWLQRYGLPTDGSADFADPDADGHNNWQEWRCRTDPTNALSVLRLLTPLRAGTNVTVSWQSVEGVNYFLERSTNLSATPPFTLLAPNLPGQSGAMTFTDTNAAAAPRLFYRVGVP